MNREKAANNQQISLERFIAGNKPFRIISAWLTCSLTKLLFRIEYVNQENIPVSGPTLLVANHTSLLDITAIKYPIKVWPFYVAKKQLFAVPVLGRFFTAMGCIAVDRDKVDLQAARTIFGVLKANRIVVMFPQGTRVPDDLVLSHLPRTGVAHFAIKTGASIVPVLVDGKFSPFKKTIITFGEAFKLDADPHKRYHHADLMAYTISIMQKIYDLKGFNYHLSDTALLESGIARQPDGKLVDINDSEKAAHNFLKTFGQAGKS